MIAPKRIPTARVFACLAAALPLILLAAPARANHNGVHTWTSATGGTFGDDTNWTTTAPGPGDTALFNVGNATYTVIFDANVTNTRLVIGENNVLFNLGASTYTLTDLDSIIINDTLGIASSVPTGTLAGEASVIGDAAGTSGSMAVGANALWSLNDTVTVGNEGDGELTITAGGEVTNAGSFIGLIAGSSGTVTVTGTATSGSASTWTNDGELEIGSAGTGELTVEDGAEVTSTGTGYIGREAGSSGTVTVTGDGSRWDNETTPLLVSMLSIGNEGTGDLTISAGGQVTSGGTLGSYAGVVGREPGAVGTVTVTGDGSGWANFKTLAVGLRGTGELSIENGAAVTSTHSGVVGVEAGSTGTVTVTGDGSRWESGLGLLNTGNLTVGDEGSGALTISDGGTVINGSAYIGRAVNSNGTVTVTGADGSGNASTWSNDGELEIGAAGTGELTIADGGSVTNTGLAYIGRGAGSSGTVTVTGGGSHWENGLNFAVGEEGTGTLTVADGATVSSSSGFIGARAGSSGTLTVTGDGSNWHSDGSLLVGNEGDGALTIQAGGQVTIDAFATIGSGIDATGEVTVTGGGSSWDNSGSLAVGGFGSGTLTIEDGGTVTNTNGYIGRFLGSSGSVTVTGTGSHWANTALSVGGREASPGGTGTLTVELGGTLDVGETLTIWEQGTVNLFSGTINAGDIAFLGSEFNFVAGTFRFTGDAVLDAERIEGLFGIEKRITAAQHLAIDGDATLLADIHLDGGELSFGGGIQNAAFFDFQGGTLRFTGDEGLTIGSTGPLGPTLELAAGQKVRVAPADELAFASASIAPEGLVRIQHGASLSSANIMNEGEIELLGADARVSDVPGGVGATLENTGLIHGSGRIGATLINNFDGQVRVDTGDRLVLTSFSGNTNDGAIHVRGGSLDVFGELHNGNELTVSNGSGDVFGTIFNQPFGQVRVADQSVGRFYGEFFNEQDAVVNVQAASRAVFLGDVFGGGDFQGPGTVEFASGFSPGASPGLVSFGGDAVFQSSANLQMELGGAAPGDQHDRLDVAGLLALDGTLDVSLIDSFMPSPGDSFEILTAGGGIIGTFATQLLPMLTGDLFWNVHYGANSLTLEVAAPGLPGDYNSDGAVNAADYIVWRKTDGTQPGYDAWRDNFGQTAGGSGARPGDLHAVPEPAAVLSWLPILLLAIGGLNRSRRR